MKGGMVAFLLLMEAVFVSHSFRELAADFTRDEMNGTGFASSFLLKEVDEDSQIKLPDQVQPSSASRAYKLPREVERLLVVINAIKKNMAAKKELCGRLYGLFYSDRGKHRINGLLLVAGAGTAAVGLDGALNQEWGAVPLYASGAVSSAAGVLATAQGLQPGVEEVSGPLINVACEPEEVWPKIKRWLKASKVVYGATSAAVVAGAMALDGASHGTSGGAFTIKAFTWSCSNGVTAVTTHAGASTAVANGVNLAWGVTGAALTSTDVYDYWLQGQALQDFHDEVHEACHAVMDVDLDDPLQDVSQECDCENAPAQGSEE